MPKQLDVKRIEKARQQETSTNRREAEKQRIREAFEQPNKGGRVGRLIEPENAIDANLEEQRKLRVAAYCRVSTQEEKQAGSFELQVQHFKRVIMESPQYEFVEIYKDEGVSGTQVHGRIGFQKMVEDAKAGKIDLILTKSISRLGRNVADVLQTITELNDLEPSVVVYFEQEGLRTDNPATKIILTLLASLAEMESQQKSEAIKFGIRNRMSQGAYRFSVHNTIGYFRDYAGRIRVNEEEAEIVKYVYDLFLEGASPSEIADALTNQGISSPMHKDRWTGNTIKSILTNEKYCGDVLYQKTYSKSYISHKSVKNNSVLPQWYWENNHTAIIKRSRWQKAQELMAKRKWHRGRSPVKAMEKKFTLSRIKSGPLRGYILIDMDWNKKEREQFIELLRNYDELPNAHPERK